VKVAYWPGCVSRGFTPKLHGSMAQVAPLLDIELVELDRAACCGAGVIAEHNQELADTLNARTFALAQREMGRGAELMMNICSTCQGAQSECQERLDANSEYREHVNETLSNEGLHYARGIVNKHLLWLMGEEAQTRFIPAHDGQPSRRSAWADADVNARWGGFYRDTAETLEAAYVRPRHEGYVAFQGAASALLREAFASARNPQVTCRALQDLYHRSRKAGAER
jgi:hypothetical protein